MTILDKTQALQNCGTSYASIPSIFQAAGLGFGPRLRPPEGPVLPLHYPALHAYYIRLRRASAASYCFIHFLIALSDTPYFLPTAR